MPDVRVADHGSVVLITPLTDAAKTWVGDHVHLEDWQWAGPGFAVDHRFTVGLLVEMSNDGLTFEEGEGDA